jgi:hypothetical protein
VATLATYYNYNVQYESERVRLTKEHIEAVNVIKNRWNTACTNYQKMYENGIMEECKEMNRQARQSEAEIMQNVEHELASKFTAPSTVRKLTIGTAWILVIFCVATLMGALRATRFYLSQQGILPTYMGIKKTKQL